MMYLSDVRHVLCHLLCTDPMGFIGQQCTVLANNVPEDFPSIQVLRDYAEPLTSWSQGKYMVASIPEVCSREVDISGLQPRSLS